MRKIQAPSIRRGLFSNSNFSFKMNIKSFLSLLFLAFFIQNIQSQSIIWSKKSNSVSSLATYSVTFSVNGEKVLSGSECHPANIRMFDVATGDLDWTYNVGTSFMCIQGVKFSPNSSLIASVEELGNILIFNNLGSTPTIMDTIDTGTSYAFSADFSPANDRIAVGASSGKMIIYNLSDGSVFTSISAHPSYVFAVAYSPDGSMIASGGADNKAKIWTADGTLKSTLTGHSDDVVSVKFSPDNTFLATGGLDGKVKIWNTADGSLVQTIDAHADEIKQVDISPDGSMLVSASRDQTSKIWNFQTGELLSTFGNPNGGVVWSAVWSPDGSKIVTGTGKGDVILWDVAGVSAARELPGAFVGSEIFPNPATEFFNLKLPDEMQLSALEICDATGKTLLQLEPAERQISVAGFQQGIYFLKMNSSNGKVAAMRFLIGGN